MNKGIVKYFPTKLSQHLLKALFITPLMVFSKVSFSAAVATVVYILTLLVFELVIYINQR